MKKFISINTLRQSKIEIPKPSFWTFLHFIPNKKVSLKIKTINKGVNL